MEPIYGTAAAVAAANPLVAYDMETENLYQQYKDHLESRMPDHLKMIQHKQSAGRLLKSDELFALYRYKSQTREMLTAFEHERYMQRCQLKQKLKLLAVKRHNAVNRLGARALPLPAALQDEVLNFLTLQLPSRN